MATFKVLEDYAPALTRDVLGEVGRRIRRDLLDGIIDDENYDELSSDLRDLEQDYGPPPSDPLPPSTGTVQKLALQTAGGQQSASTKQS